MRPWRAPTTLAELFGASVSDPTFEMLAARCVLVDEGELVRSGKLPSENLAALPQAPLLLRQLTRKFGILPDAVTQRIQAATPSQLETWSLNILDAETLDEVFTE